MSSATFRCSFGSYARTNCSHSTFAQPLENMVFDDRALSYTPAPPSRACSIRQTWRPKSQQRMAMANPAGPPVTMLGDHEALRALHFGMLGSGIARQPKAADKAWRRLEKRLR
jgi:hypothetical protein